MRDWSPAVVAAIAVTVAVSWGRYTYPVLLTAIQADLGLTYSVAGGVASANLVAYLVGTVAVTLLATKMAPGLLMLTGLIGSVVGLATAAMAGGVGLLLLALVVTGVSGALVWVPAPAVGVARLDARSRGIGFGIVGAGIGIGLVSTAGMAMVVRSTNQDAWRWLFAAQALVGVVAVLGTVRFRSVAVAPTAVARSGADVLRRVPRWGALVFAYMAFAVATSWGVSYLVAMAEVDRGMSSAGASSLFVVMGAATIVGGVVGGRASQAFGHRSALLTGFLLIAVSAVGLRFGSSWLPYASAVVFGLCYGGVPVGIAAYVADHVPDDTFSSVWGAVTVVMGPALMVAPHLGGVLADSAHSFTPVFGAAAAVAVVGAVLSAGLSTRPKL